MTRRERRWLAGLAIVLAVAAWLRFSSLGTHSLWYDEACTVYLAGSEDITEVLRLDRQPPVSLWLLKGWMRLFGQDDGALRAITALAGMVTVVVAAMAARTLIPERSLWAAGLIAVAPFHVWYSLEVRSYAFVGLCGAAALLLLARIQARSGMSRTQIVGTIALCALAPGLHYSGFFVPAVLVAGVSWLRASRRLRTREAVLAASAAVIGSLAWLPWMLTVFPDQLRNPWGHTGELTLVELALVPARLIVTEVRHLDGMALGSALAAMALTSLGMAVHGILVARRRAPADLLILIAWMVPIAGFVVACVVGPDNFSPRYFMLAAPAAAMAVVEGLGAIGRRTGRILLSALLAAGALVTIELGSRNLKEDYRGACELVGRHWREGDVVASVTGTLPGHSVSPLHHYLDDRPKLARTITDSTRVRGSGEQRREGPGRLHLVYRRSSYAAKEYERLRGLGRVVIEGETGSRIAYVMLEVEQDLVVAELE